MSMKSKRGIEESLGIASASELQSALETMRNASSPSEYDIDDDDDDINDEPTVAMSEHEIKQALAEAKHLKAQLRQIPDILSKETEIDDISNDAAKYFGDIMDKAFNTEDRFAPELFNSANSLLKTALDGKNAIINAKLKLLDLELKKQKIENDRNKNNKDPQEKNINNSNVVITDRNSLLRKHTK